MSVLLTIAVIFLVITLWRKLVWPMIANRAARSFEQRVNDYFRQAAGGFEPFGAAGTRPAAQEQPHPRKVFSRDMGEYVAFEDIAEAAPAPADTYEEVRAEEQVSDAEWEEVR